MTAPPCVGVPVLPSGEYPEYRWLAVPTARVGMPPSPRTSTHVRPLWHTSSVRGATELLLTGLLLQVPEAQMDFLMSTFKAAIEGARK